MSPRAKLALVIQKARDWRKRSSECERRADRMRFVAPPLSARQRGEAIAYAKASDELLRLAASWGGP